MQSYGIASNSSDQVDLHSEELRRLGYTVLPEVLGAGELEECRARLDTVYALQSAEFGAERLAAIKEANLARLPLSYDAWFLGLVERPAVLETVRAAVGDYVTLHLQNGILNSPEEVHHQTSWHRDLPYQEWVSSKPLAVSALFCVDDFNAETGGTFVLPGSHRDAEFPSAAYVAAHERQIEAPAGAVLVFDAMLYHRAGTNRSRKIRRGINHVYTIPIIRQQIDIPAALGDAAPADAAVRRLLGFDVSLEGSVLEWREKRAAKS